jgi:hypothetical protein
MSEQFPKDEIDGKPRAIVHIWSAALDPHTRPQLVARVTDLMRNVGVGLEGFVEGRVFEAADGKSVTAMSTWKTRHLWANALRNQRVDLLLESVQPGVKMLDSICYETATIVPTEARSDE